MAKDQKVKLLTKPYLANPEAYYNQLSFKVAITENNVKKVTSLINTCIELSYTDLFYYGSGVSLYLVPVKYASLKSHTIFALFKQLGIRGTDVMEDEVQNIQFLLTNLNPKDSSIQNLIKKYTQNFSSLVKMLLKLNLDSLKKIIDYNFVELELYIIKIEPDQLLAIESDPQALEMQLLSSCYEYEVQHELPNDQLTQSNTIITLGDIDYNDTY